MLRWGQVEGRGPLKGAHQGCPRGIGGTLLLGCGTGAGERPFKAIPLRAAQRAACSSLVGGAAWVACQGRPPPHTIVDAAVLGLDLRHGLPGGATVRHPTHGARQRGARETGAGRRAGSGRWPAERGRRGWERPRCWIRIGGPEQRRSGGQHTSRHLEVRRLLNAPTWECTRTRSFQQSLANQGKRGPLPPTAILALLLDPAPGRRTWPPSPRCRAQRTAPRCAPSSRGSAGWQTRWRWRAGDGVGGSTTIDGGPRGVWASGTGQAPAALLMLWQAARNSA